MADAAGTSAGERLGAIAAATGRAAATARARRYPHHHADMPRRRPPAWHRAGAGRWPPPRPSARSGHARDREEHWRVQPLRGHLDPAEATGRAPCKLAPYQSSTLQGNRAGQRYTVVQPILDRDESTRLWMLGRQVGKARILGYDCQRIERREKPCSISTGAQPKAAIAAVSCGVAVIGGGAPHPRRGSPTASPAAPGPRDRADATPPGPRPAAHPGSSRSAPAAARAHRWRHRAHFALARGSAPPTSGRVRSLSAPSPEARAKT